MCIILITTCYVAVVFVAVSNWGEATNMQKQKSNIRQPMFIYTHIYKPKQRAKSLNIVQCGVAYKETMTRPCVIHRLQYSLFPVYLWLFRSGGEGAHVCRNIGATSRFRCTCCTFPVWKSYKCVERARPPVDFIQCNVIHTVTMTRQRVLYR